MGWRVSATRVNLATDARSPGPCCLRVDGQTLVRFPWGQVEWGLLGRAIATAISSFRAPVRNLRVADEEIPTPEVLGDHEDRPYDTASRWGRPLWPPNPTQSATLAAGGVFTPILAGLKPQRYGLEADLRRLDATRQVCGHGRCAGTACRARKEPAKAGFLPVAPRLPELRSGELGAAALASQRGRIAAPALAIGSYP